MAFEQTENQHSFGLEEIAVFPPPGMKYPNKIKFSADDHQVLYLFAEGESDIQQLYAFDTASGETHLAAPLPGKAAREEDLSPEEELARQRQRMSTLGLTDFRTVPHSNRILIPVSGDVYVQDGPYAPLRKIVDNEGKAPALTPQLSPDGQQVAYVQNAELYVAAVAGGDPRQLTHGASATGKTHGLAEFMAQEEMDRFEGFWWSPDNRWIAFTEVDEAHIPAYPILHLGNGQVDERFQETHHYPFAGARNATVRLAVVSVNGGEPVWMDLNLGPEFAENYIGRVFWWHDGSLGAQILNRAQTSIILLRYNIHNGTHKILLREDNLAWITLRVELLRELDDERFIWCSERSGFCHVYLYSADGTLIRPLTSGEWVVDAIEGVDETNQRVYFTGNREHPTQKHLYVVGLTGGEVKRLSPEPGTHQVVLNHSGSHFVDVFSALSTPPSVTLRSTVDGSVLDTIYPPADTRVAAFKLHPPKMVTLQNRYGDTLYGVVYQPPEAYGPGPFPTVVLVYGGPGPQLVTDNWRVTANLQAQYLCESGYLVFWLDNRGSARRGQKFEAALKRHMGTVEVDDQSDGVLWLVDQGLADRKRIGVYGWSYGGYMALMCLAKAGNIFKLAVSGAPVVDWAGYDTCYTERYMETPLSNPEGYKEGSVLNYISNISGKLLLVHGLLDENVHFRHTARLINGLIAARKHYELLVFPDERHMPRHLQDRVYMYEQIIGYLQRNL